MRNQSSVMYIISCIIVIDLFHLNYNKTILFIILTSLKRENVFR